MCKNFRSEEVKGSYLLLIRKLKGEMTPEDESFLRGIICFFEYIISLASSQESINDSNFERCFKSFSTKSYLGSGLNDLNIIIREREQKLFILNKTEDFLKITKSHGHDIEININNLEKIFCVIREYLQKKILMDSKNRIIMVLDDKETIHKMSMDVISNGKEIFYISF